jgi:two-component system response regulator NreC
VKILVIEDHAMVRGMIARVCREAFAHPEVAEATSAAQGLALCAAAPPDLILLDLDLPDRDGLDLIPDLRTSSPSSKILVLSASIDPYSVHRIEASRVEGFIDKNEQSTDVLCEAMRKVAAGGQFFSAVVTRTHNALRADPNSFPKIFSDRELELLSFFGQGLSNEAIAERFKIHHYTVRNYRRGVMLKLGIHSTPELIRYCLENGFTRVRRRTS